MSSRRADAIAERFHVWYEHYAPQFGYETRPESAVPWEQVPENNRRLMAATVVAVLTEPGLVICWAAGPDSVSCDREAGHAGPHSWDRALSAASKLECAPMTGGYADG